VSQSYTHNPRPTKGPVTFTIDHDRLVVDNGRQVREVPLGSVEQVRMTYETKSLGRGAYQTRIRTKDGTSLVFSSLSWKSLVDVQSLDREYRIFTRALFDAVGRANPAARFLAGRPRMVWIATAILAVAALAAMAIFIWRAIQAGAAGAAAMAAFFTLVGIWQIEPMIRLNKPGHFTPDEPPHHLLP
jgi:hypothetical protein